MIGRGFEVEIEGRDLFSVSGTDSFLAEARRGRAVEVVACVASLSTDLDEDSFPAMDD